MVWKDYFYFSKSQRRGIIVLIALILVALLSTFLMPYFIKENDKAENTVFLKDAEKFKASLTEKERTRQNQWDNYSDFHKSYTKKSTETARYQLFAFDPNTADSATFVRLGLKPYIAKNILKYRSKGGKFRKAEDFGKVYGISSEKAGELMPYIQIAEMKPTERKATGQESPAETNEKQATPFTERKTTIVELNTADTTDLIAVKGIGRRFAKRILGYRRILGGYHSVEQIREVYGMNPENFEQIKSFLSTDASLITKISINKASVERLKSHPYLNFSKAREIYELRRDRGKLKNIEELRKLHSLSDEDLQRIEPYLSFE